MSVTAAKGFAAGAVHSGIRKQDRLDLALLRSLTPATGAGMFTVNRVQAAPVTVSRDHLEAAQPQAIVANSGVANAATGAQGLAAARAMTETAAAKLGLEPEQVLVLSTGVIGEQLPLERVLTGIDAIELGEDAGGAAAQAIMTTDTHPKQSVVHGPGFTVGGMAKGSGMIHPCLATMLAVVTTDYPLEPGEAVAFLRPSVDASFNAISVDGECSTNDAVLLLANGASGCARDDEAFAAALRTVCGELAKQIVADGEGATVLAEIAVRGAVNDGEARAIAERVATSPLVKTALYGHDANWGRIAAAAGSAKVTGGFAALDQDKLSIVIDGVPVLVGGVPSGDEPELTNGHCAIELDLALGDGVASYLTTDLSYDYVRINAEYRS
ncbi:MAG: bifunctional glutamate N-acetyltransferase/amino-acid acetyltransferase ArgJ [Actinobacteria bacterium]|nr:MAG: bifunctional glutamate N-acetyltransferase/amino-acid acetyltransferase ArgJ [Actinomycetota bacterium]